MTAIFYETMLAVISAAWCVSRAAVWVRMRRISWKREAQLLLVYVCIAVIVRFTFCPFEKIDGRIQPLIFDPANAWPPRINLVPFTYLFDYEKLHEALLNLVGNVLMFVPVGIVLPSVYRRLNTHGRAVAAGVGFSLAIELMQLPFVDRVSDIDDLLLNSAGYLLGYLIYLAVKRIKRKPGCR